MDAKKVRLGVKAAKTGTHAVLIASGKKLFAQAIGHALKAEGLDVLPVASTGAEVLARADRHSFATALIDLDLPDARGVDVGMELLRRDPKLLVIAMSDPVDLGGITVALEAGFRTYLTGGMDVGRILAEINSRTIVLPDDHPAAESNGERLTLDEGATAKDLGHFLKIDDGAALSRVMQVIAILRGDEKGTNGTSNGNGKDGNNHYPGHLRRREGVTPDA